jgi:hypothetical protein
MLTQSLRLSCDHLVIGEDNATTDQLWSVDRQEALNRLRLAVAYAAFGICKNE